MKLFGWILDEMFKRDDIHDYTKTIVKSALSGQGLYKSETPILSHLKMSLSYFLLSSLDLTINIMYNFT